MTGWKIAEQEEMDQFWKQVSRGMDNEVLINSRVKGVEMSML